MWQSYSNCIFSRNSYHLQFDEQTDIIHDNNEKTRPIYTKNVMNQVSQWQNRTKFGLLIDYNMLNYDRIKSGNKTEQSSVYSII